MIIENIKIKNFRSGNDIEFDFHKQLNLFVGINGAGKSTILDALSICLSWVVKRIEKPNGKGFSITDSDITINQQNSFLNLQLSLDDETYIVKIAKMLKVKIPM